MLEELTPAQARLMRFIGAYWQRNKITPTIREMMNGLNYSSPAPVRSLIKVLARKGYIKRTLGENRNIRIVHMIGNIPIVGTCN